MPGLSYYFTIAIIVFFLISLFSVVLSLPESQQPLSASPSPQQAQSFKGFGQARARVLEAGSQFLVQCKQASEQAVKAIEGLQAVQTVFKTGSDVVVVIANASFLTGNASVGRALAQEIHSLLATSCEPRVLRAVLLEFDEPVKLNAVPGSQAQGERLLYPLELRGYGLRTAGTPGVVAYADGLSVEKNSSIAVFISASLEGNKIAEFIAEQQLLELLPANAAR